MEEANHPKLDLLARWIEAHGYIVCASAQMYDIGHVIDAWVFSHKEPRLHHPLKVIAVTDLKDFLDQGEFVYGNREPPDPPYRHFYRCITD